MWPNMTRLPSPIVLQAILDVQRTIIFNPLAEDFVMSSTARDSFGEGAKQKPTKRKLDSAGYVHSSCGLANGPAHIKRLGNRPMLASSLAEVSLLRASTKSTRRLHAAAAPIDKAPFAVAKLKGMGGPVSALAIGEIFAIVARYFKTALGAGVKASVVKQLENLIAKSI